MNQSLDHSEHLRRPDFLSNDAVSLVSEFFGIDGTAKELPGERDRNFLIQNSKGQRFVLKIFNQCEKMETVDLQISAMNFITDSSFPFEIPRPIGMFNFPIL